MSAGNDNLPIGPKDITDIFKLASELFAVINEGPTTIPWNQKAAHWWSVRLAQCFSFSPQKY
jgi:hypothetical protein